ncbi:hypothetical protein EJB05_01725, partial [Eragrostis curvula]
MRGKERSSYGVPLRHCALSVVANLNIKVSVGCMLQVGHDCARDGVNVCKRGSLISWWGPICTLLNLSDPSSTYLLRLRHSNVETQPCNAVGLMIPPFPPLDTCHETYYIMRNKYILFINPQVLELSFIVHMNGSLDAILIFSLLGISVI